MKSKEAILSPYQKKAAHALQTNIHSFIKKHGLNNVGFLTLTFPDHVTDNKEASRRFGSLVKNYLNKKFPEWVAVKELTAKGRWHYHLLVYVGFDIRTRFDFEEIKKRKYSSASWKLRRLWSNLRHHMGKYGFGRAELLPIRKNGQAVAYYISKYFSKSIGNKLPEHKGIRLVSYCRIFEKKCSLVFSWVSDGSKKWRLNLAKWALVVGIFDYSQFRCLYGAKWAYKLAPFLFDLEDHTMDEIRYIHQRHLDPDGENSYFDLNHFPLTGVSGHGDLVDLRTGQLIF